MRAHNDFVQAFAERGVLGGIGFAVFILGALLLGIKRFDTEQDPKNRLLIAMAACGLLAWSVVANFTFPLERPFHTMMLVFFVSVLGVSGLVSSQAPWVNLVLRSVLGLLVGGGTFAAFLTMRSETHNLELVLAKGQQNWPKVVRAAQEAEHWPFEFERHTFTPYAWYLGNAYLNMGQNAAAHKALKRAYELQPWHPQVGSNYGASLVGVGDYQGGVQVLEELLSRYPAFHEARMNLTELYFAMAQIDKVNEMVSYWESIDINPTISVYLRSVKERLEGN